ncbi:MAG: hypothetical protein ACSLE6_03030 [Mycobacterium sp.]
MKLARPEIRHRRIVLAGCARLVAGDGDDDGLIAALRARGLHARWLSWDDPLTEQADVVILRATWDYVERLDEFLAWARRVPNLLNSVPIVEWNTDKTYLMDLATAGVPVVESEFFGPDDLVALPAGEVVVKPSVGAGSFAAQRFSDHTGARAHAAALQEDGRTVLVQPYDARIEAGETALVFLGGRQSHAFVKGPILPPPGASPEFDESGTYATETLSPADPDFELWDLGHAALDAAARRLGIEPSEFLYARVDVIGGRENPLLLELELVEPSLGWRQLDDGARRLAQRQFALGVEAALQRLGLDPLAHRRP